MYIVSCQPLKFSNITRCRSVSSAVCSHLPMNRYTNSDICGMWKKNGIKEDIHYMTSCRVCFQDLHHAAKRGCTKVPQVCTQDGHFEGDAANEDIPFLNKRKIEESIDYIKKLLSSVDDGRISVSPYDTAWVALIRDLKGRDVPQFPSSLEWIANNQLPDGSWGDEKFYLAYDRIINTLACVVALRSWNVYPDMTEKGISFIKENISMVGDADAEQMTCGFELVFPALLQRAKDLGIDGIPYDASVIKDIYAVRDRKLERVPKELLHEVPTRLPYNLEGLGNLDLEWPKILKLQTPKGSFFTSPAATAFAFMETKDESCLQFINYIVNKFNGGAPTVYPVDIFGRLLAVDPLQRLGISRFFEPEIKNCLDYVYSYWSEEGVFCARESEFRDIDDTSMGFRLLRLHGYNIRPDALSNFKKENEFTCDPGQGFESPSPIFNLYRASQVQFPGETILEEARDFSYNFLQERLQKNQLLDKRLISEHFPDEIKNGLEMPWYASLPRVEARYYIENYGVDDIWIGKSLFRMPEINNEAYLQLAKLDYSRCQVQHLIEWNHMQKWYEDSNLEEFGISKEDLLLVLFLATASIFEPEKSGERTAWVKSQIVSNILLTYYFIKESESSEEKTIKLGKNIYSIGQDEKGYKNIERIICVLFEAITEFKKDAQHRISTDISDLLHEAWGAWLKKLGEGAEDQSQEVELLVRTINICGGRIACKDILLHQEYKTLSVLTNKICQKLQEFENEKEIGMEGKKAKFREIEKDMQLLVQLVLHDSPDGISRDIKRTFLPVAKSFYYRAYFTAEQIKNHVSKVLFEQVV